MFRSMNTGVIILVAKKNVYENYKKQMIDTGLNLIALVN